MAKLLSVLVSMHIFIAAFCPSKPVCSKHVASMGALYRMLNRIFVGLQAKITVNTNTSDKQHGSWS